MTFTIGNSNLITPNYAPIPPADSPAANIDAPTPWRIRRGYTEISWILDARGHTVTLCRREIAERIVQAVNAGEGRQ